jgi:xanthine dehydrogenase small subunit
MKPFIRCIINDREIETSLPTGTVTLDFLRQQQKLPGTKEGCKEGECGACTVLIGQLTDSRMCYKAVASCLLPLGELDGKHVVTIEGLNSSPSALTPVQQVLVEEGASQCGFCTPGIVMSLTGFCLTSQHFGYQDALDALDGNICRCTGYVSIQRAAQKLCEVYAPQLDKGEDQNRISHLVEWKILPDYFLEIPARLKALETKISEETPPQGRKTGIIVAGATDLYVQRPEELHDEDLEFVSQRSHLTGIRKNGNWLFIGAGTTVEEMKQDTLINEYFPGIRAHLNLVSSTIMRNRATLAGNIVNASPIGDLTVILLAMAADLCLVKGNKRRELPLKEFFKGYKKLDLKKGELIETIEIPIPYPGCNSRFHFEKVSRRTYLDIASCNSAISLEMDERIIHEIHLSAGGVSPIPLYLTGTCNWLRGKEITAPVLRRALEITAQEIAPISDVRGSAAYKSQLLKNLILAHFITLFPEKNLAAENILD